jgi:regulator of replication initiation timing
MYKVTAMRQELDDLDTQRHKEHEEQDNVLHKIKRNFEKSEQNNIILIQKYDQLQQDFDYYKDAKEDEIAGLKIDNNTLHTEYCDYKTDYNDYQLDVGSLKKCLDKLRSDYKLLSLENETLQKLLEKEKNIRSGRRNQTYERRNSYEREPNTVQQMARSKINPYESLPVEKDALLEPENSNSAYHEYFSVRGGKKRAQYTPNRPNVYLRTKSPEIVYELRKKDIKYQEEINLDTQSPVLGRAVHKSDNEGGFSVSSSWIQNPF